MPNPTTTKESAISDRQGLLDRLDEIEAALRTLQGERQRLNANLDVQESELKRDMTTVQRALKRTKAALGVPLAPIFMRLAEQHLPQLAHQRLLDAALEEQRRQEALAQVVTENTP